ncbi:MAG: ABC transporter permease [Alphaproteobacteria bacterium]
MFEWLSDNRALVALFLILALLGGFAWSIVYGVQQTKLREKDQVFGDPERTAGGWFWAACGISALLLVWFFYSWGAARAFFPQAANELCQVAKLHEAVSPVTSSLAIESRYSKSKTLLVRNSRQIDELRERFPAEVFDKAETVILMTVLDSSQRLMSMMARETEIDQEVVLALRRVEDGFAAIAETLETPPAGLAPTAEALAQPAWGVSDPEIPLLPVSSRGVLFDQLSSQAATLSADYLKIRNLPAEAKVIIEATKARIAKVKKAAGTAADEATAKQRQDYVKAVERIFRRIDDGKIFPTSATRGVQLSIEAMYSAADRAKGSLGYVESLLFPGGNIVKSRTQCTEQGPGRWLPKPTDVVATFAALANPDIDNGGGYKGTTLLWWKWLAVADVVAFLVPDGLIDIMPGEYGALDANGEFVPNYKDTLLAFAQGDISLGHIPMLDGHIWDSLFRVIVAMFFGILLGVPLGIYMGVSRFCKSFFDPMIELYRPVPPLAWAPLILTIFGIQDDGKIFLLFMVAFAIMVISARTGASGAQLSKIRASHSLGASDRQILRYVILPNALPEILTGVRISVGVCWGTLVAAEMLAGTTGVGFIENVARTVSDYELIWVTILIMGSLGLLFDLIMRWLIGRLIPWRGKG